MAVKRWVLTDPYDTNPATNHYLFPRNPASMTSIYFDRAVSGATTVFNKRLVYEGTIPAKQFSFSGPVLEKGHFDALRHWTYDKRRRIVITDHYGRKITCVLLSVEMVPKRRVNYYYSHDYTVTGLVLTLTEPTIPNEGYVL